MKVKSDCSFSGYINEVYPKSCMILEIKGVDKEVLGGKMVIKVEEGSKVTIFGKAGKMTVDLEKMLSEKF